MSKEPLTLPQGPQFSQDQLDAISGGACTADEIVKVTEELKTAYENLIDFTSHVIERVIDSTTAPK